MSHLHLKSLVVLLSVLMVSSMAARASAMPVNEIIEKANLASFYAGKDGRSQARMKIVDKQGREQIRQFTILRNTLELMGDQQMMVFFSRPSDVRGTVFRVEKKINGDDDRWLYLPGLDLLRRISAGDKRTSFVGSHFFYEDVSGRNPQEDNFMLLAETKEYYVLEAKPKKPSTVEFSHYNVKIDKTTFLPVEAEYYNQKNAIYRRVSAVKVIDVQGFPTVVRSKVEDVINGGYTLMEFRGVKYNIDLPTTVFTERAMRNPPTQQLR